MAPIVNEFRVTIGAIQGPCLETYNDSHWGFIEAYEEVVAQTRELNSGFRYLWVFGFWVLHSEFKNQWFFYINVNHPIIWICYPLFILMVFGNLVYCIQTLLHVSETNWLNNGRSSRIKDFGRIVYGIWSDWIGFFPIVTYNFWLIKYHESEMFIEWMLSMSNQWDPTPKVSKTKSVDDEFF
jgi:hypothetical protein